MGDFLRRLPRELSRRLLHRRRRRPAVTPTPSRIDQPLLSVVVVAADSDGSAGAGVAELSRQTLAQRDQHSLQIIVPDAPGLTAARNAGLAAATAPYLTFLDAADSVPNDAYQRLISTLERTGSDFATGTTRRDRNGRLTVPVWSRSSHTEERLRTDLERSPNALADLTLGGKVFRRSFWLAEVGPIGRGVDGGAAPTDLDDRVPVAHFNERIGPTEDGVAYADHLPMLTAYLRARSFDILTAVTRTWRVLPAPPDQSAATDDLGLRLDILRAGRRLATDVGSGTALDAWTGRVLSVELPILVQHAVAADPTHRRMVSAAAAEVIDTASSAALLQAPVDRKLLVALAAADRWDQADDLLEAVRLQGSMPATSLCSRGGGSVDIVAKIPYGLDLDLPVAYRQLGEHQARLEVVLSRLTWGPSGTLVLDGWALIRGIDLTDLTPEIGLELCEIGGTAVVGLRTELRPDPSATEWANDPEQRYGSAGFRAVMPAGSLPDEPARWQVRARVEAGGVRRGGRVGTVTRFGSFDRLPSAPVVDPLAAHRVVVDVDDVQGLVLEVRVEAVRAQALGVDVDGTLFGTLLALPAMAAEVHQSIEVALQDGAAVSMVSAEIEADRAVTFRLPVPPSAKAPHLRVRTADGRSHRVGWPADTTAPAVIRRHDGQPAWQRSPRGNVQVLMPARRCQVDEVVVTADAVRLSVATENLVRRDLTSIRLSSPALSVEASDLTEREPGRFDLAFASCAAPWHGDALRSLPTGTYELVLDVNGERVPVTAGPDLLDRLPEQVLTDRHAVTVTRAARSTKLQLILKAPLRVDERARVEQRHLQRRYRAADAHLLDQIYFQSYRGEFATDSQLALHHELRRRATSLELLWGIADTSVALPEGARGVLIGSAEWYEVLGRSRYLCSNVDFDRFFRRRSGQRFLQTFHGYPFKSMGVSFWQSKGLSARAIAYECDRRNAAWTSILVPASFCVDLYRENYGYRHEVLVTGYPRNDVLAELPPDGRNRVLDRLGVRPDQRVVLYAPTWRESLAVGAWTARPFDELDLDALCDALGPGTTILLRGHTRTMRDSGHGRTGRSEIIDVTRYPEINDLILAAEVAVLDYSSLRFDWMITEKPMVFFVPDLDDYLLNRTGLLDYGPTAPGPLLRTTGDVIEALRDLDLVSATYAAERAAANTRFNGLHDGHATDRVLAAFVEAEHRGAPT